MSQRNLHQVFFMLNINTWIHKDIKRIKKIRQSIYTCSCCEPILHHPPSPSTKLSNLHLKLKIVFSLTTKLSNLFHPSITLFVNQLFTISSINMNFSILYPLLWILTFFTCKLYVSGMLPTCMLEGVRPMACKRCRWQVRHSRRPSKG